MSSTEQFTPRSNAVPPSTVGAGTRNEATSNIRHSDSRTATGDSPSTTQYSSQQPAGATPSSTIGSGSHTNEPTSNLSHNSSVDGSGTRPATNQPQTSNLTSGHSRTEVPSSTGHPDQQHAGDVHPSAVGSDTRPEVNEATSNVGENTSQGGDSDYPEQKHAGAVGYGPNFHKGPTTSDKIGGMKKVLKGKVTRNPDLVNHGHEQQTGALAQKEKEADDQENPFGQGEAAGQSAAESKADATGQPEVQNRQNSQYNAKDRAATVAPEGTSAAEAQREGDHRVQV